MSDPESTRPRRTYEELVALAARRSGIHDGQSSRRALSENYEVLGLLGEDAFARAFGLGDDHLELKPGGDGRVDFVLPCGTVDVKTADKPYYLLRERGVRTAEILVLAGWNRERRTVTLIGWEYDREMVRCPLRDFGKGVVSHYKRADRLRKMRELRRLASGRM